jgi:hypothetical protein
MKEYRPVDQALRNSVPELEVPPGLHTSIMHAVRTRGLPAPPVQRPSSWRWLPAPMLVALFCAVWAWHLASKPPPARGAFERAGTALATSEEMARAVPATAVAPLIEEWQRLNQDLDNTAQFLVATLP